MIEKEKLLKELNKRLSILKKEQAEMSSGFKNGTIYELETIIKIIKQMD